jgi:hypothetical protein
MEEYTVLVIAFLICFLWIVAFRRTWAYGTNDDKTRMWFMLIGTLVVMGFVFVVFVWPEFYCSPYLCNLGELVMSIMFAGLFALIMPIIQLTKLGSGPNGKKNNTIDHGV